MHEIGHLLKEQRLAHGFDLSDVARKTCISAHYLKAMEEGRFHIIPRVFDRGYLKIYANLLDMDTKPLLALYERKQNGPSDRQAVAF